MLAAGVPSCRWGMGSLSKCAVDTIHVVLFIRFVPYAILELPTYVPSIKIRSHRMCRPESHAATRCDLTSRLHVT